MVHPHGLRCILNNLNEMESAGIGWSRLGINAIYNAIFVRPKKATCKRHLTATALLDPIESLVQVGRLFSVLGGRPCYAVSQEKKLKFFVWARQDRVDTFERVSDIMVDEAPENRLARQRDQRQAAVRLPS